MVTHGNDVCEKERERTIVPQATSCVQTKFRWNILNVLLVIANAFTLTRLYFLRKADNHCSEILASPVSLQTELCSRNCKCLKLSLTWKYFIMFPSCSSDLFNKFNGYLLQAFIFKGNAYW